MAAHPHSLREAGPEGARQFRRACCASIDRERVLHTASTRMFSKDNSFQVTLRNAIRERSPDQPGVLVAHIEGVLEDCTADTYGGTVDISVKEQSKVIRSPACCSTLFFNTH